MTLSEFLDKLESDTYAKFTFGKDIKEMRKVADQVDKPSPLKVTKEDIDSLIALANKLRGNTAQAPIKRTRSPNKEASPNSSPLA